MMGIGLEQLSLTELFSFVKHILVGGLEHEWIIFHNRYMGCHPKPIDELHHFSEG